MIGAIQSFTCNLLICNCQFEKNHVKNDGSLIEDNKGDLVFYADVEKHIEKFAISNQLEKLIEILKKGLEL